MDKPNDYPFYEVVEEAGKNIERGFQVFQKFTCEACGNRLTIDVPNKFYTSGSCDKCSHVTNLLLRGCNYMMIGEVKHDADA